mmetsp:Transcript_34783/g.60149  ORF Transcript_34783/g.60149 Transcript_34783/m.60149 type:complete len:576 (+) Transcript_34783:73-1800(+)
MNGFGNQDLTFGSFTIERPYTFYALLAICISYTGQAMGKMMFGVAKIPYVDYDSISYSILIGPTFTISHVIAGVLLAERIVKDRVFTLSFMAVISSTLLACVGFTTTFWQVGAVALAHGAATGSFVPISSAVVADYYPRVLRGTAMAILKTSLMVAYGAAMGLGTVLYETFGWKAAYISVGVVFIAFAVQLGMTVKDPDPFGPQLATGKGHIRQGRNDDEGTMSDLAHLKEVIAFWNQNPALWIFVIAAGFRNAGGSIWQSYQALFFDDLFSLELDSSCSYSYDAEDSENNSVESCSSSYPYCIDGFCNALNSTPWHAVGMPSNYFAQWTFVVIIFGGSLGSLLNGVASDKAAKKNGLIGRINTLSVFILISVPFCFGAVVFEYPYCFMSSFLCYAFGEGWQGVVLTCIMEFVPGHYRATSVGLGMAVVALLGSSATVLVPWFEAMFDHYSTYEFYAAPTMDDVTTSEREDVIYNVRQSGAIGLQRALQYLWPGFYLLSVVVFLSVRILILRAQEEHEELGKTGAVTRGKSSRQGSFQHQFHHFYGEEAEEEMGRLLLKGAAPGGGGRDYYQSTS